MIRFLLLIFISLLLVQAEHLKAQNNNNFTPKFFIDLATYESADSGKTKLDVFIKVPYSNIQFLKTGTGYFAKYSITVSIYNDDDELQLEKLWNEKIGTREFKQTISETSYNISYRSFNIIPDKYKFVCKLEDLESRKHAIFEQEIDVRKYEDSVEISDVVIVSEFVETEQGLRVIPSISNLVATSDSSLSFFYEIYSDMERKVKVVYSIKDSKSNLVYNYEYDEEVKRGITETNKILNGIAFGLGNYQLEVKIIDNDGNIIKGTGRKFSSKIPGIPSSIKDLDLAIKQMQYIASSSEIDELTEIENYEERLENYLNYWKQKDPSPNTVDNEAMNEYYRRVEYANANFKGYFKGWRSDMGMIYITLGPPDHITRRPYEMDSRPYEIWEYYALNKSFVFIDRTNFGDYRLYNPVYGEWFRYRP